MKTLRVREVAKILSLSEASIYKLFQECIKKSGQPEHSDFKSHSTSTFSSPGYELLPQVFDALQPSVCNQRRIVEAETTSPRWNWSCAASVAQLHRVRHHP